MGLGMLESVFSLNVNVFCGRQYPSSINCIQVTATFPIVLLLKTVYLVERLPQAESENSGDKCLTGPRAAGELLLPLEPEEPSYRPCKDHDVKGYAFSAPLPSPCCPQCGGREWGCAVVVLSIHQMSFCALGLGVRRIPLVCG